MQIQLKKFTTKPSVMTCIRSDGSSTWHKIYPGLEMHDIGHFVVESQLAFYQAFFGLVDQGYEAADFELPQDKKPEALKGANLPLEAIQTEHIVNLLQTELSDTSANPQFLQMLGDIFKKEELPFPNQLDEAQLTHIRKRYRKLLDEWHQLESGATLYLNFEILSH